MKTQSSVSQGKQNERLPELLSKLWVFLSLNYILCDLLTGMEASVITVCCKRRCRNGRQRSVKHLPVPGRYRKRYPYVPELPVYRVGSLHAAGFGEQAVGFPDGAVRGCWVRAAAVKHP